MRPEVHVNGKWLAQSVTGTQRYAGEIVRNMLSSNRCHLVIHVPANAPTPDWMTGDSMQIRRAPVGGVVFEQLYLPLVTAGNMLLNFAGPAPLLKRRQLVTMHDATTFRYPQTFRRTFVAFYYVMYWLLARTAVQLVTVSRFSARELAEVLGISADRFLVVPCAADAIASIEPVRPALELDSDPYLVVGTQAHHKNLAGPIAALVGSGRCVVVVGVAGDHQVFSATSSLDMRAVAAGRVTDGQLVWLYQNSRALIFPSKYEGFGMPPLEAQMLGCPVVCSSAASLPEVCGDAALYFDPDDTASLLLQIERLERDLGLAGQLRGRGFANAQRYSWDASARIIADWVDSTQSRTLPTR